MLGSIISQFLRKVNFCANGPISIRRKQMREKGIPYFLEKRQLFQRKSLAFAVFLWYTMWEIWRSTQVVEEA